MSPILFMDSMAVTLLSRSWRQADRNRLYTFFPDSSRDGGRIAHSHVRVNDECNRPLLLLDRHFLRLFVSAFSLALQRLVCFTSTSSGAVIFDSPCT